MDLLFPGLEQHAVGADVVERQETLEAVDPLVVDVEPALLDQPFGFVARGRQADFGEELGRADPGLEAGGRLVSSWAGR